MILVHQVENQWQRFAGTPQLDADKVRNLIQTEIWTEGDYEAHGIKIAVPFVVPEGRRTVGAEIFIETSGIVSQSFLTEAIPPPSATDYAEAIENHVDQTARAKAYSGAVSLASYVNSSIPTWQAEAATFVLWRDSVLAYAYEQMALVQAGQRPQPSVSDLIAELPAIQWPEGA